MIRLVIVCPSSDAEKFRLTVSKFAAYDWEQRGQIHLWELDAENSPDRLLEHCAEHGAEEILVPHRVHCGEDKLTEAGWRVTNARSIQVLIGGGGLRHELARCGLDWRSEVAHRLSHYGLAKLGITEIESWLKQFDRLGDYKAVGIHLLQLLDVLPPNELADSLTNGLDFFRAEMIIGFNQDRWGKSWGTVSNLVGKKSPTAQVLPIHEAFERAAHPDSSTRFVHLVEDGLFSATETTGIFDSLLGQRAAGRQQKVPALPDPKILLSLAASFRFGLVTDYGEERLRQYFTTKGLNIQVAVQGAARRVNLLGPPQSPSIYGSSPAEYRARLLERVEPHVFQPDRGWRADVLVKARKFCPVIGAQLWREYLLKKGRLNAEWPNARITRCALGMDGLGLTFAFAHSVPKASLPLFWARGNVEIDGRGTKWEPLFPYANS